MKKDKTYDVTPYITNSESQDCIVNISCKEHNAVIDNEIKATCTKTGLTKGKHCSVCNTVIVAQTKVKALGHKYSKSVVKATLTSNGKITKKCTVCSTIEPTISIARIKSVSLKKSSYTYNGKVQKPSVIVKDANKKNA